MASEMCSTGPANQQPGPSQKPIMRSQTGSNCLFFIFE